ncbi:MAG: ABC transporter ATP-binding protein [Dehalococcoidales bacterium]|nr:ABC transporter ATP-binding protein [Dehalococcoidales bacterium]
MAEENILVTRGLTKRFGNNKKSITAVDNLDLEVHQGEVFGFLGPNGSGKTTTIGMLLGFIWPTSGSIEFFSDGKSKPAKLLRRIGVVMDSPSFFPYLSGLNNLRYFAMITNCAGRGDIDRVIEMVGLKERAKDKVRTYSMGMKQRLSLALALMHDPELVILDEPTNGLDPAGIIEFRETIRRLQGDGKTVFLSSHLLSEVEKVCSHVALISRGRILASGSVEELLGKTKAIWLKVSDADGAVCLLEGIEWIKSVKKKETGLVVAEAEEQRAYEINELLISNGIHVNETKISEGSLEDFFLATIDAGDTVK